MMNNPGYKMDAQRITLETIAEDTPYFVSESFEDYYGYDTLEIIDNVCDLLIPNPETLEDHTKMQAFLAGGLAVFIAFSESDCGPERIEAVSSRFVKLTAAETLDVEEHDSAEAQINIRHINGLYSHGEIKDHLDYISQYYVGITKKPLYGYYVYLGGGFCAYELDRCYEAVLDTEVTEWIGEDLNDINWNKLLESN